MVDGRGSLLRILIVLDDGFRRGLREYFVVVFFVFVLHREGVCKIEKFFLELFSTVRAFKERYLIFVRVETSRFLKCKMKG